MNSSTAMESLLKEMDSVLFTGQIDYKKIRDLASQIDELSDIVKNCADNDELYDTISTWINPKYST